MFNLFIETFWKLLNVHIQDHSMHVFINQAMVSLKKLNKNKVRLFDVLYLVLSDFK